MSGWLDDWLIQLLIDLEINWLIDWWMAWLIRPIGAQGKGRTAKQKHEDEGAGHFPRSNRRTRQGLGVEWPGWSVTFTLLDRYLNTLAYVFVFLSDAILFGQFVGGDFFPGGMGVMVRGRVVCVGLGDEDGILII